MPVCCVPCLLLRLSVATTKRQAACARARSRALRCDKTAITGWSEPGSGPVVGLCGPDQTRSPGPVACIAIARPVDESFALAKARRDRGLILSSR
uniref:Putative secreted peptide n=1 Tax=Anopheles braziliensis TaxID=58242 RepID=A0A2M3ZVN9_9DIPT